MRRAFVIGSNGPAAYKPLKYALSDVENVSQSLKSEYCRYEVFVPEPGTSVLQIRQALYTAVEMCTPEDLFICYFSGHGVLERGALYLLWDNTVLDRLLSTAIPASLITLALAHCKARNKLLILDCCHAGAVASMPGIKREASISMEEAIIPDNYLVLMASKRLEEARELDSLQGSFLTANVCAALTSRLLEADKDRDGRLSYPDLQKWLEEQAIIYNQVHSKEPVPYPHWFGKSLGNFFLTDVSADFTRKQTNTYFLPDKNWSEAAIMQFGNRETIQTHDKQGETDSRVRSLLILLEDDGVTETKKSASITAICALVGYGIEEISRSLERIVQETQSEPLKTIALAALKVLKKEMIYIPAGKVCLPDDRIASCNSFYVDKHPVTNREFHLFVNETGYEIEGSWRTMQQNEDKLTHPVTNVTFKDASQFAAWVSKKLPTEIEWLRAAYGESKISFPWGNNFDLARCNTVESGIGTTSPINSFPGGASRQFGVHDLVGNVWEWIDQGTKLSRVIRGGSWKTSQESARRDSFLTPNLLASRDDLGFRCVRPTFLQFK